MVEKAAYTQCRASAGTHNVVLLHNLWHNPHSDRKYKTKGKREKNGKIM